MALKNNPPYNDQFHDPHGGKSPRLYVVEHLATLPVSMDSSIVYPSDGMRRLLQLEKNNGVWYQRMKICLDASFMLIIDYYSGSVMEKIACQSIQDPTAFTSNNPMDTYNNVLIFIVLGNGGSNTEMHLFQCYDVDAHELVKELNHIRGVKGPIRKISQTSSGYSDNDGNAVIEKDVQHYQNFRDHTNDQESNFQDIHDDDASVASFDIFYEEDTAIMNRCFDDIEKFIARLQDVDKARRELERRKRPKKSKKKTDPGEGMLEMRAKLPMEREFYDVFQKFKLSFNMLGKLKDKLQNPSSAEFVHFLFTPLGVIINQFNSRLLAAQVVQPLLTRDTINLMTNSTNFQEKDLWHSLGDAWLISRDQWKTSVPPYQPVFMDGWTPYYPVIDENIPQKVPNHRSDTSTTPFQSQRSIEEPRDEQYRSQLRNARMTEIPLKPPAPLNLDPADISPTKETPSQFDGKRSSPENEKEYNRVKEPTYMPPFSPVKRYNDPEQAWAEDISARGGKIAKVIYAQTANNDRELSVVKGEILEILDDSRKWWKARNRHGDTGHIPSSFVTTCTIKDLSFDKPMQNQKEGPRGGNMSPQNPSGGSAYDMQEMNDEMDILMLLRNKKRTLDVLKTPDLYINQASKPEEVQAWLEAKGFDENVRNKLRGIPAADLFRLPKSALEEHAGGKEGRRLFSQLLVQRNVSGYKTTSAKELAAKLKRMKDKVDS